MTEENSAKQESSDLPGYFSVVEEWSIILMVILSLAGIWVMRFSPTEGYWYWVVITLIFGLFAMLIGFVQTRRGQHVVREIWIEQSRLWFGVVLALCGTLLLLHAGKFSDENAGLVILLILSLATYIDGLKIGWRFSLVGNFLGLTAVTIAYLDNFVGVLFSLAAVTIAVTIIWQRQVSKAR